MSSSMSSPSNESQWCSLWPRGKPRPTGDVDLMAAILRGSPKLDGASCAQHPGWFDSDADDDDTLRAIDVCTRCPVMRQCYAHAEAQECADGVYGGKLFLIGTPMEIEDWLGVV